MIMCLYFFFCKQKTAYEMRMSDWSSDVCSSDLILTARRRLIGGFYAYDNQMKTTKLDASCSDTTDAQGLAGCTLEPDVSGEVYVVATTADSAGNVARATRSVWLAGDDDWWFGGDNGDRMEIGRAHV